MNLRSSNSTVVAAILVAGAALCATTWALKSRAPQPAVAQDSQADNWDPSKRILDRSGKLRVGEASFYAREFVGRKMADGNKMNPRTDNAASKTLPLGTTAKVTNLETGKSAIVTIQDRGPYVGGRIVDLSPATAHQIGLTPKQGVTKVAVAPIAVPLADGSVKPGVAAPGAAAPGAAAPGVAASEIKLAANAPRRGRDPSTW